MTHTIYKGQVNVEVSGNSYRIRFTHHGQRKCFGTGLKVVDKYSENAAIAIAKQIEADMYKGVFDETLERYKPEVSRKPVLSLVQQFDVFLEAKKSEVRQSTFNIRYLSHQEYCKGILKQFKSIYDVVTIYCVIEVAKLKATLRWNSIKCKVTPLILFWDYLQADIDIPVNPWRKALSRLKVDEIEKPEPFSANEREQILNTMLNNESLRVWEPITRFLMSTGCRPGEVFALTYGDVDQLNGYLTISKSSVNRVVGKTKTSKVRKVPLSDGIRIALEGAVQGRDMYDQSLCFPHPENGSILTSGIYLQHWKKALKFAGVKYRKPYANRHTFITEALLQGGNPAEVAKIAGNSPKVIYQHYLNVTGDTSRSMPDI